MISERAKKIKPSPTLAIDAKAKAMKAEGIDVVNFGVGEPDFDTPENIKEAGIKSIRDGKTKYTPAGGLPELKSAITEKFKKDNGLEYSAEEIIVSCGGKHSLYNISQALLSAGDEVIIPAPYWVSYPDQTLLNDATPVIVETTEADGFTIRPEALEKAITKKTRLLILNSPSNPTGLAYSKDALNAIADIVKKHENLYIVSDEIYEKILYDGAVHTSIASFPGMKERTIIVNGVSKAYAMTGWRIGYAAGPKDIIKAMTNIQSQSTSNPSNAAQYASVEALKGPQDFIKTMNAEFDKRRKYLVKELNAIPGATCLTPTGAFYAFPNVSALFKGKVGNSTDLALYLLEEAKVAVVQGSAFGAEGYIRLSYATSMSAIEKGVLRIQEAVAKL